MLKESTKVGSIMTNGTIFVFADTINAFDNTAEACSSNRFACLRLPVSRGRNLAMKDSNKKPNFQNVFAPEKSQLVNGDHTPTPMVDVTIIVNLRFDSQRLSQRQSLTFSFKYEKSSVAESCSVDTALFFSMFSTISELPNRKAVCEAAFELCYK